MHILGVLLLVSGAVFLLSGLIVLLPAECKLSSRQESFDESQQKLEHYLGEIRRELPPAQGES
jgi:hypothetical protein